MNNGWIGNIQMIDFRKLEKGWTIIRFSLVKYNSGFKAAVVARESFIRFGEVNFQENIFTELP